MLHRNSLTKCLPDKTSQKYGLTKCLPDKTSKPVCWRNVILTICLPDKASADLYFGNTKICGRETVARYNLQAPSWFSRGPSQWLGGQGGCITITPTLIKTQITITYAHFQWYITVITSSKLIVFGIARSSPFPQTLWYAVILLVRAFYKIQMTNFFYWNLMVP